MTEVPTPPMPPGHDAPLTDPVVLELAGAVDALGMKISTLNDRLGAGERRTVILSVLVGIVIILSAVVIGLGIQVRSQALCQGEQNDAFRNASLQGRAAANAQADQQVAQLDQDVAQLDAQLTLLTTSPSASLVDQKRALADYIRSVADTKTRNLALRAAIVAAKQSRADNPLPAGNCT